MSDDRELLSAALPRYVIGDELGRGGWGVVYRGEHRELGRPVAIKQLLQAGADHAARDRFVSEARLVASLEHPHIVPVYDFVEHEGVCAIVMELAPGGTLGDRLPVGLPAGEAIAVVLAVAIGLDHAHQRQLLHRDVKPDNVLFTAGTVKITDFGIAKVMGAGSGGPTVTGTIIGTPTYMAPEQVTGGTLSAATDIYSLAILAYQLLAGELPYPQATEQVARLFQHVHEEPRPLTAVRDDIDPRVAQVIHRALSKDPGQRQPTAERFAVGLAGATAGWLGRGWLARSGIAVMGSNAVIAAAEQGPGSGDGSIETIVSHTVSPTVVAGAPATPIRVQPVPTHRGHADRVGDLVPPLGFEPPDRSQRPARALRWPVVIAAAATVVLLAGLGVVGFLVAAGGGGEAANTPGPITREELDRFVEACTGGEVSEARCRCVATRLESALEPDVFRVGLETMVDERGVLTPELETVFQACVDDGF